MSVFISIAIALIVFGLQVAFSEDYGKGSNEENFDVSNFIRLAEEAKNHYKGEFVSPADKGKTYDVGEFTVFVPEGWMAIPVMNAFGDSPNTPKTNSIKLCKGAFSPFDIMTKPNVEIVFYGKTQGVMPPRAVYKNVVDLDSLVTGDHCWGGFQASAFMGKKLILLWEDTGVFQYQVNMWIEGDEGAISINDEDVINILGSITPNVTL